MRVKYEFSYIIQGTRAARIRCRDESIDPLRATPAELSCVSKPSPIFWSIPSTKDIGSLTLHTDFSVDLISIGWLVCGQVLVTTTRPSGIELKRCPRICNNET